LYELLGFAVLFGLPVLAVCAHIISDERARKIRRAARIKWLDENDQPR
jgi:hypothetical protein